MVTRASVRCIFVRPFKIAIPGLGTNFRQSYCRFWVEWEILENFWNKEFPDEFKDGTVFQMEPFPKEGLKKITFISKHPTAVSLVNEKYGIVENKYWTSVGSQGLKRLTGKNSEWNEVPLRKERTYIPMTQEGWENILLQLENCYKEFMPEYQISQKGKNKKIRKNADSNVEIAINRAIRLLHANEEVFELFFDDDSDYGRAIAIDEFKNPRHFDYDIKRLMSDIKHKIEKLKQI